MKGKQAEDPSLPPPLPLPQMEKHSHPCCQVQMGSFLMYIRAWQGWCR